MFFRLFPLFVLVPLIELYLLIRLASVLGAGPTILIVLVTGALGAYFARQQGFRVWGGIRRNLEQGCFPADSLVDGLLVLIAGLLLITPGVLTDVLGFLLLIPGSRTFFRRRLIRRFEAAIRRGGVSFYGTFGAQERPIRDVTDSGEKDPPRD